MGHRAHGPPRSSWRVAATVLAASFLLYPPDGAAQDPSLSIGQEPPVAVVGGEVTLRLQPVPASFVVCTWYRGVGTEDAQEVLSVFGDPSLGTEPGPAFSGRESGGSDCALRVSALLPADTGAFTVSVRRPQRETANATLRVYLPLSQPTVTPAEVTATENSSVALSCDIPPDTDRVSWLRDEAPVTATGSLSLSPDNRTVALSPVQRGDAGAYVCQVANAAGANRSDAANVTVLYGPDSVTVTPRGPLRLPRGSPFQLLCSAASHPAPNFSWSHQNTTLGTGPRLALTLQDPGHYRCQATNPLLGTSAQASVLLLLQEQGVPSGAIAGIVVGTLLALCLLLGSGYGLWRCAARSSSPKPDAPPGDTPAADSESGTEEPKYLSLSFSAPPRAPPRAPPQPQGGVVYAEVKRGGQETPPQGVLGVK